MSSSGRSRPTSLLAIGAVAAIIVALLAAALLFGMGSAPRDSSNTPAAPIAPVGATAPTSTTSTTVSNASVRQPIDLRLIARSDALRSSPVVDQLEDGDVLRVRVANLRSGSRGHVKQCVRVSDEFAECGNEFPIQAADDGVAYFQYQVRGDAERCDVASSCVVVATDDHGGIALAYTLFGATAPRAATVHLRPAGPYRAGMRVEVRVDDLPTGAEVNVAFCTPACSTPATATADRTGTARAGIAFGSGCDRGDRCVVLVTGLGTRDAVTSVRFRAGPTASYDAWRTAVGLGVAALLLLAARLIVRRTDWHAPTEAATPALDQASL